MFFSSYFRVITSSVQWQDMDSIERNVNRNLMGKHFEKQVLERQKWELEYNAKLSLKETGIGDFLSISILMFKV